MPNRSKQKGDRAERAIVELFRQARMNAYRVPLSGAARGFKDDVELRLGNITLRLESKVRSKGFGNIYKWLENSDILTIKADRKQPLIVLRLNALIAIAHAIAGNQTENVTHNTLAQPTPEQSSNKSSLQPLPIDPNLMYPALDCLNVNAGE